MKNRREKFMVIDSASYREEVMRAGRLVAGELIKRKDEPEYEPSHQSPYDAQEPERAEPVATV